MTKKENSNEGRPKRDAFADHAIKLAVADQKAAEAREKAAQEQARQAQAELGRLKSEAEQNAKEQKRIAEEQRKAKQTEKMLYTTAPAWFILMCVGWAVLMGLFLVGVVIAAIIPIKPLRTVVFAIQTFGFYYLLFLIPLGIFFWIRGYFRKEALREKDRRKL